LAQYVVAFGAFCLLVARRDGRPYASPRGLDRELRREVTRFGGWFQLSGLLEWMTYETDPILMLYVISATATGF
jgi:O-antigen/teichoic acid export membrane protein